MIMIINQAKERWKIMRRKLIVSGLAVMLIFTLFLLQEQAFSLRIPINGQENQEKPLANEVNENLLLELKTNNTYFQQGEAAAVSFVLLNSGESDITFTFNTGQHYDLLITQDSEIIWSKFEGLPVRQVINEIKIKANNFLHDVFIIPAEVIESLEPGQYDLLFKITARDEFYSQPLSFQVKD